MELAEVAVPPITQHGNYGVSGPQRARRLDRPHAIHRSGTAHKEAIVAQEVSSLQRDRFLVSVKGN